MPARCSDAATATYAETVLVDGPLAYLRLGEIERYVAGKQLLAGVGNASLLDTCSHVVSTYDGQLLRLSVDGKELARKADARPQLSKSTPFLIGSNNGMDGPVLADVDEVAVYDNALAPERITAHYLRGAGP